MTTLVTGRTFWKRRLICNQNKEQNNQQLDLERNHHIHLACHEDLIWQNL
jgi:hypothetical protein